MSSWNMLWFSLIKTEFNDRVPKEQKPDEKYLPKRITDIFTPFANQPIKLRNDLMIIKYCDPTLINIKDSLQRGKVKNRNEKVFKSLPFLFIFAKRRRRLNIWGYPPHFWRQM